MKITGDWLTNPATQTICALLTDAGHQALFVGGCVRNALLGLPAGDIDLATDALPARVMALAARASIAAIPTGIDHGTVTLVVRGLAHEVTTFRRDVATDGRHATVAFTSSLTEDAKRRDFTMNALYATPDGTVIDPLGGLSDLIARRLRFVGDPVQRITEDHLRILRFFRFHALYADPEQGMDAEALAACAAHADGIDPLSRERIGAEMRKLLGAPDPAPAVAAMAATGILARVLPGADATGLAPLIHLESGQPPQWLRRLAALGGPDPTDALRLSRAESRDLVTLRDLLSSTDPAADAWKHGSAMAQNAALLRAALTAMPLPADLADTIAMGAAARFPVQAADLMPALQGPALGVRLAELQARWIASGFRLGRDDLLG